VVTFDADNGNFSEDAGTVSVGLTLNVTGETTLPSPITLDVAASGAAAAEVSLPTQITFMQAAGFPEGTYTASADLTITDNVIADGDRALTLTLSNPPAAISLGAYAAYTFTVVDDEVLLVAPTNLAQAGENNIAPLEMTFSWLHQPAVGVLDTPAGQWYNLFISGPTGEVYNKWFTVNLVCVTAYCEHTIVDTYRYLFDDGAYTWTVTSWTEAIGRATSVQAGFNVGIGAPSVPVIASVVSNFGQTVVNWPTDTAATWYRVQITDMSDTQVYSKWQQKGDVCADSCSLNTGLNLPAGDYIAVVSGYGPATYFSGGSLLASDPFAFTVDNTTTTAPSDLAVADGFYGEPELSWAAANNATYYQVSIIKDGAAAPSYKKWSSFADLGCGDGTCELDPGLYLRGGAYTWSVQAWGPTGFNNNDATFWVTGPAIDVTTTPASPPTDITATDAATATVTITWTGDANASWYQTWVGVLGDGSVYYQWDTVADLGCKGGGTCTLTVPGPLDGADYQVYIRAYGPGGGVTTWSDAPVNGG